MGGDDKGRIAVIAFAGARDAGRRIAGVAAAARILREVEAAGFTAARLVVPGGRPLSGSARDDVARLAGGLEIELADPAAAPAPESAAVHLPGNRLLTARQIAAMAAGDAISADAEGLRLDQRGASAEILRRTGKPGDGPVSRWLNRPISRRLSALLLLIPAVRPIHATAGTALLALLMFASLLAGGASGLVAGAILFQAASIFDGVDGELARATFRTSRSGAVLDSIVDAATNILFVLGLTIHLLLRGEPLALPLAAWGFALWLLGLALIAWRASRAPGPFSLNVVKHHYRQRFPGPPIRWLISLLTIFTGRDFFALLFAALVVAGWPMAVMWLFAAAATLWILFVAGAMRVAAPADLASRCA